MCRINPQVSTIYKSRVAHQLKPSNRTNHMDPSYPVTPYPLSPYGNPCDDGDYSVTVNNGMSAGTQPVYTQQPLNQQQPSSNTQQQARQLMNYLISPPPPSGTATVVNEPARQVYIDGQSPRPTSTMDNLFAVNGNAGTIGCSSYESVPIAHHRAQLPSPTGSGYPTTQLANNNSRRVRPATDYAVFPASFRQFDYPQPVQPVYYHQSPPAVIQEDPKHQTQQESTKADPEQPQPPTVKKRISHARIAKIMAPYWMVTTCLLLLTVIVMLGNVMISLKQANRLMIMNGQDPPDLHGEFMQPSMQQPNQPSQQQPMQPQHKQQRPQQQSPPRSRSRSVIHAAQLPFGDD